MLGGECKAEAQASKDSTSGLARLYHQDITTLALPWKPTSSPDCTWTFKLQLWFQTWADTAVLHGLSWHETRCGTSCGWLLSAHLQLLHSPWWLVAVVDIKSTNLAVLLYRAKTNAQHRFVGSVTVDINCGVQNYPRENHCRQSPLPVACRPPHCFTFSSWRLRSWNSLQHDMISWHDILI